MYRTVYRSLSVDSDVPLFKFYSDLPWFTVIYSDLESGVPSSRI